MPGFRIHISASSMLGVGYGAAGLLFYDDAGLRTSLLPTCLLATGLCSVSGMLPDLDSGPGIPLRESLSFAAAFVPMLLFDRARHLGWSHESMVLAGAAIYMFIRFGVGWFLRHHSIHRGIYHSIPVCLIFAGLAFLLCNTGSSLAVLQGRRGRRGLHVTPDPRRDLERGTLRSRVSSEELLRHGREILRALLVVERRSLFRTVGRIGDGAQRSDLGRCQPSSGQTAYHRLGNCHRRRRRHQPRGNAARRLPRSKRDRSPLRWTARSKASRLRRVGPKCRQRPSRRMAGRTIPPQVDRPRCRSAVPWTATAGINRSRRPASPVRR